MAEKENPIESGEKKVESMIKSEPWYVWAGAAAAAGVMVYFIWKRKKAAASTSSASTTSQADANGITQDTLGGLSVGTEAGGYNYQGGPVGNYPFAETSVNGNNVPIIPSGDVPIYDSNGNLIGFQSPSPTTSPNPTPVEEGIVRASRSGDSYDKNHPGIPVADKPGGTNQFFIPFGSEVSVTGAPTIGPTSPQNTNTYYQVSYNGKTGYVSSFDLPSVFQQPGKGGGGMPDDVGGFHLPVNAGRNTIDQWAFANGMHGHSVGEE